MLTNVSSLTSNIRLVEISNEIKDVCSLDFTPCPPLSPGMSANFKLTFRPTNADAIINGRLVFQTQSGLLEIPVKCCPPMIEPKLVTEELDFGREVLGETIIKNIKIINEGQLSGQFKLSRVFKCRSLIGWDDQRIRIILKTGIRIESDEFDEDDSDEIIMTQVGFQMDSRCLIRQPISADLMKPFEHNENQVYEFPSNTEIQIPVQFNPNVPGDLRSAQIFIWKKISLSGASFFLIKNLSKKKVKLFILKLWKSLISRHGRLSNISIHFRFQ